MSVLQRVAMRCSVLQRVAVRCFNVTDADGSQDVDFEEFCVVSVLQCTAMRWSVLQCVAVCCKMLQRVAVCCSALFQFDANGSQDVDIEKFCVVSVLQCAAVCSVCSSVLQCAAVRCGALLQFDG